MSGGTSQQVDQIDENSCHYLGGIQTAPCILYFDSSLEAPKTKIRNLVQSVQLISDDSVRYVDPTKTDQLKQELLKQSGLDFVVVLSGH